MAKRKTIFLPNHYYHIYNRGVNKQYIFRKDDNYLYLLSLIGKNIIEYDMSIIAYCLMPNHYHFLLFQNSEKTISEFIQRIFNSYTKAFNKMYNRSGTLFEGPFKAIYIDSDEYLIHLCRYIHRNPIDTNVPLVNNILDWPYSNFREWIGLRNGILIDKKLMKNIRSQFGNYGEFVHDAIPVKVQQRMEKYFFE